MRARVRSRRAAVGVVSLVLATGGCGSHDGSGPSAAPTSAMAASSSSAASPTPSVRPPEVPAPGNHQLAMTWDGLERTYEVHAPPGYRPGHKLPLVVAIHHLRGDPVTMRQMTQFDAKADKEGFLVAYPNGVDTAFNALICCSDNDDVGFIRAMVERLTRRWGADPARVYATGISQGADMSFRLAVEVPGMFAAIAPVSGGFLGERAEKDPTFKPSRPVSVVSFIGDRDRLNKRMQAGLRTWYRKLGCTPGATAPVDPGKTVNRTAATCADRSDVVSYFISGMGHSWPGGTEDGLGDPDTKINAVDVMWTFFKSHPRRS